MEKVENYEKFMELWNISHKNRYWGNKRITPEHEKEIIERANIQDFKRYNIYMLEDGYHFIVFDTKWSINTTLWYDDEKEDIGTSFEVFKHYNEMNRQYSKLEKNNNMQPYFMINYCNNDQELCVCRGAYYSNYENNLNYAKEKNLFVRYLTDEEIEQYNTIVDDLNKLYDERLEKYYKKYGKHIQSCGYWVNR